MQETEYVVIQSESADINNCNNLGGFPVGITFEIEMKLKLKMHLLDSGTKDVARIKQLSVVCINIAETMFGINNTTYRIYSTQP